jgi:hypothetical protein
MSEVGQDEMSQMSQMSHHAEAEAEAEAEEEGSSSTFSGL